MTRRRRGLISCLRDARSGRILETIPRGAEWPPPVPARPLLLRLLLAPPASRRSPVSARAAGSRAELDRISSGKWGEESAARGGPGRVGLRACGVTMKDWGAGLRERGAETTSRCAAPRDNLGVVAFESSKSWVQVGGGTCGALLSRPRRPRTARPLDLTLGYGRELWGVLSPC